MSLTNPIQVNAGAESSIEQPISTSSTTTKRKQADDQIDQDDQDDDDDDDDDEEVVSEIKANQPSLSSSN